MLTTRNIQLLGIAVLIAAATLVTISAIRFPAPVDLNWPTRPDFSQLNQKVDVPMVGSAEDLAQYYLSERGAPVTNQHSLDAYFQSERMQTNPSISSGADLSLYFRSEREAPLPATNGLAIYHQSERMQAVNGTNSNNPLKKYHQSEWFGK